MTPSPVVTRSTAAPQRSARPGMAFRTVPPSVRALVLEEPLPGFPGHVDYVLVAAEPTGRLVWFQSRAADGPRFLAAAAAAWFPDYAPALPPGVRAELGIARAEAELFCLVTVPGGDVAAATANLRAPVVINPVTARARQVVLADGGHPIRRPLRR